ncbi:D-2-hydroxyacid dehydrogenase [Pseudomonas sp. SCB32]|uniref:D-2-hydroxyacid dehydrogenase n=1 Tax=Pseudomonas sp. SCB32 TaxID=2653853 RepID=UPI0012644E63|nr:D-2-hydroxyacid dehydrogenase [Pseudomonas sp. SCB32]
MNHPPLGACAATVSGIPAEVKLATPVLLLESRAAEIRSILALAAPEIRIIEELSNSAEVETCEIWLGEPDRAAALLRLGYSPRWLQSTWAGYKPLLAPGLPKSYRLSRAVGVFGQAIAEYALTHLLAHTQHLRRRDLSQAQATWDSGTPAGLSGARVLIAGAGEIGCDLARFLRPFGVTITGMARGAKADPAFDRIIGPDQLLSAAGASDFIINLLPDTPETADIFDERFFHAVNPNAVFINAGRGTSVVDQALISALADGRLAWAVLDVFREEPLPRQHPFWTTPRLTITAHVAGPLVPNLMARQFLENLSRYRQGQALKGQVDFHCDY